MTRATMTGETMPTDVTASKSPDAMSRGFDLVTHVSPLIVATAVALAVGQPIGWIAFLFPVGPLVIAGCSLAVRREAPRAMRSLLAFTITGAVVVGGGWLLTQAGDLWAPLSLLFPLGLLAFIAGLVNVVLVVLGRIARSIRGWSYDYPWIIAPLARLVGLPDGWEE